MKYTVNVAGPGVYTINSRVASQTGGTFHYELDGTTVGGELVLPNTGGWQTYTTVPSTSFTISTSGQHIFRIVMDSSATPGQDIGNFNWFQVNSVSATPSVTIAATTPTASETTLAPGQFTVTRTGPTTSALNVFYTVGGTATSGTDYTPVGTSVSIPVGQASTTITVTPINDGKLDGTETVILSLASNAAYSIGSPAADTVSIVESNPSLPSVTVAATTPIASESPVTPGVFTITRGGPTTNPLTVNFTMSGTATSGVDYPSLGTSVVIPAGQSSTTITLTPINDGVNEGNETAKLTLSSSPNYQLSYVSSDFITITDPGTPSNSVISISLINADTGVPVPGFEAITNGESIDLSQLGTTNISLRANTNPGTVGSVQFSVNNVNIHIDNNPPYAFLGNNGVVYTPWNPGDGVENVKAQSFSSTGASGTAGTPLNLTFTFSGTPTVNGWASIATAPINWDEGQVAVVNGKIYVLGGFIDPGYDSTHLANVYDPIANLWSALPNIPETMTHGSTVVVGTKIWVIGSFTNNENGPASNHVWIYDTVAGTWTAGPNLPANAGAAGGIGLVNNKIYYFAGLTRDATTLAFENTNEVIDLDLNNIAAGWQQLKAFPTPRNHLGSAVLNGVIYAIGGQNIKDETAGESSEVDAYNIATDTWTQVANLPVPIGHDATSVVVYNNTLLVVDGETLNKTILNTVYQYNPVLNTWTNRTDLATPSARKSPIIELIGNQLFAIEGGQPDPTTGSGWVTTLP
jgi:Carbohydrate binding module (family 6)/Kelch motif/Calx-beta domain/Galactose oxidase, central domain